MYAVNWAVNVLMTAPFQQWMHIEVLDHAIMHLHSSFKQSFVGLAREHRDAQSHSEMHVPFFE